MNDEALRLEQDSVPPLLAVDDEPNQLRWITRVVEPFVSTVEVALAQEAVRILRSSAPLSCAVMDVVMPDIDGKQLAAIAKSERHDLPILFISGKIEMADIAPLTLLDALFAPKPVNQDVLRAFAARSALSYWLGDRRKARLVESRAHPYKLTWKELEVVVLSFLGFGYKEIEARCRIAEGTMRSHGSSIRSKCRVSSLEDAAALIVGFPRGKQGPRMRY